MHHTRTITLLAVAALLVFASAAFAQSPDTGSVIIVYHAGGTFVYPAANGNDLLQLAGNPFTMSVWGTQGTKPVKNGNQWGLYQDLQMNGYITSGFRPQKPFHVSSTHVVLLLSKGNPSYDEIKASFKTVVQGVHLTIVMDFQAPKGTLAHFFIMPFVNPVTITPTNATITYSGVYQGVPASTTLTIASGTLTGQKHSGASPIASLLPQLDPVALVRRELTWMNV
jgi:hypothetical protein